jgi:deazaflavin-dependent oxidoreductase (nitroreductase family)
VSDFNAEIINEFRANQGKVGGTFEGSPVLLLHHTGARSGTERVNPLVYQPLDDHRYAIFASKAGADTNPDWFHNLVANPRATIEVGTDTVPVVSRVTEGEERETIWSAQKAAAPGFAEYEQKTTRQIPVIVLELAS